MARSLWKGAIAFGLVNVPVEIFPAEEHKEFKFSMLDKRDFSPVGYKRYSKKSGKEVPWSNIVKGYEHEKDRYVVLSEEDFRLANAKASSTIDIEAFVPDAAIPPQFYDAPYYLAPRERGDKVYALLRETLAATKRVAVGQFVLRSTEHLAAVVPAGRALMLITLRYANQLRDPNKLELPAEGMKAARVTTKEVELARRLIEDMSEDWKPGSFKDTYHQDLMKRIKEKIKKGQTKEITPPSEEKAETPASAKIVDLTALLKKSLEKAKPQPARKRA